MKRLFFFFSGLSRSHIPAYDGHLIWRDWKGGQLAQGTEGITVVGMRSCGGAWLFHHSLQPEWGQISTPPSGPRKTGGECGHTAVWAV